MRHQLLSTCLIGIVVLAGAAPVVAQQFASDGAGHSLSADAQRGATMFRSTCGFCHGSEAGGAQGPNLVVSKFFTPGERPDALGEFLKSGRPAVGMPPFPTLAPADVAAIHAFVQSHALREQRAAMTPSSILVGDPQAGRRYFDGEGQCATCHSASGDLKGIGTRFDPLTLQGRMINPRVVGFDRTKPDPHPPRVSVATGEHAMLTGELVQINDFFVTLKDDTGVRRTVARDNDTPKVVVQDPADAHRQAMLHWTDRNMWDVTAYLASLK